jgi:transcription termination/antitermination protein NusG
VDVIEQDAQQPENSEKEVTAETAANSTPEAGQESKPSEMKWYVVHTYSGFEMKAKTALEERVVSLGKKDFFSEVLIPSENVVELVQGEKKTSTRKFFPGYLLIKMILNDETWHIVKNTPKITGFVGGGKAKAPSVPEKEVLRLTKQISEGLERPKMKTTFEKGESVRVIEGPFQNFNGLVDEVKPDKGKLRVLVSIFGRSTPVELDFVQVEKN